MDTGTHFVMGLGLAGLAQLDPAVSASTEMGLAVLIATVAGSQAPDLDTILRIKGNATYVRHHRGISHSIPFLLLYAILIPYGLSFLFRDFHIEHVFFWTVVALFIHVLTDVLNAYGTQALRPITDKWISLNILHIFDVFIFTTHIVGITLSLIGFPPGIVFAVIYGILIVYTLWRVYYKAKMKQLLLHNFPNGEIHLFPTRNLMEWNFIVYDEHSIHLGELKRGNIYRSETLPRVVPVHSVIEHAKQHRDIQNFLYFSRYPYVTYKETDFGYEVHFIDLRYRKKRNFPLVATIYFDHNMKPINCYVGWKHEQKVSKKLRLSMD